MEEWNDVGRFVPENGTACWVSDGQLVWFAYRNVHCSGGWSNDDTWEDFEEKVTHWMPLAVAVPAPPHRLEDRDGSNG